MELAFATPRKLPRAAELRGRVVVVDVAFASEASGGGFEKLTKPFIDALGSRLAAWVDHHDHVLHAKYKEDPRFVLATKAEHGACPEMVTAELVARTGTVDTIVCHTDFDGLCSAAKWMRGGNEPYAGADDDARAIDTRIGTPSSVAERIDRAIRGAGHRDIALLGVIVRHLSSGLADNSLWTPIDEAGSKLAALETEARKVAERYKRVELSGVAPELGKARTLAFIDATASHGRYDKTLLLLIGQKRADTALVLDRDTLTLAAPFDSGINFLTLLGLSGGMPTLVSIPKSGMPEALRRLGVSPGEISDIS
ncbi:MAG TPA: hypothetical protein VH054_17860 [Polyangiaceae bacterium]|jgi:hypothetical protein|nr:hypothetical protein [Polyangiaceae bacterium]